MVIGSSVTQVGGRVLVVAPSDSGGDPDGRGDSFTRGGNASRIDPDGETSAVKGADEGPGDDGGTEGTPLDDGSSARDTDTPAGTPDGSPGESAGSDGGVRRCGPKAVADGIADRLPVDVVLRDEQTAGEYLEELGPTIDCVVVLGDDTGPLGRLDEDLSVPAVVCEHPVVETGLDPDTGAIPVSAVASRVQTVVRETRRRSDLQDRNTRLTALSRYARDITGCETVDAVLDRTVAAVTDALAFDHCVVLVSDGEYLVPRASVLPDPELGTIGVTEGVAGRTLASGEAEIVPDMQSDPDAVVDHDELHALLSVPIGARGVLQIASHARDAFDERDRLHAFYRAVPVPAICVERRDGEATVVEVNAAYEEVFSGSRAGQSLSAAVPTETERGRYEAALDGEGTSRGPVVRRVGSGEETLALTIIPVAPPGGPRYAFGVYRTARVDGDADGSD